MIMLEFIFIGGLMFIIIIQNIMWNKERKTYLRYILNNDKHAFFERVKKDKKPFIPKYRRILNEWRSTGDKGGE